MHMFYIFIVDVKDFNHKNSLRKYFMLINIYLLKNFILEIKQMELNLSPVSSVESCDIENIFACRLYRNTLRDNSYSHLFLQNF